MIHKKLRRERRAKKTRSNIRKLGDRARLSVHMSGQHIYAQIFSPDGNQVITSASTLDKEVAASLAKRGLSKANAAIVGKVIAQRAATKGISAVAFDRGGFKYHGRVKALADAAREGNLNF